MPAYYAAYRRPAERIEDPALPLRFQLEPGRAVQCRQHARPARARRITGGGKRWLQGCYADKDGLFSRLAAVEEEDGA
jgi:gamma-butyrobetaine dioxygenase